MNFKTILSLTLIVGIMLAGCSKQNRQLKNNLLGSWQFLSSSGGHSGGGNPSYNSNYTIKFNKTNRCIIANDGKKISNKHYRISAQTGKTIRGDKWSTINYISGNRQVFYISKDTLFLADDANDGFSYVFAKIN